MKETIRPSSQGFYLGSEQAVKAAVQRDERINQVDPETTMAVVNLTRYYGARFENQKAAILTSSLEELFAKDFLAHPEKLDKYRQSPEVLEKPIE